MLPFYCTGKVCNRRPRCWVWVPKVHGDSEERGYALWESNQSGSEIGETPHKHVRHRGVKNAMAHSLFVSLRLPGRWPLKRNEAASIFRSQPRRHPSVLWWAWLFMGLLRLEDTVRFYPPGSWFQPFLRFLSPLIRPVVWKGSSHRPALETQEKLFLQSENQLVVFLLFILSFLFLTIGHCLRNII